MPACMCVIRFTHTTVADINNASDVDALTLHMFNDPSILCANHQCRLHHGEPLPVAVLLTLHSNVFLDPIVCIEVSRRRAALEHV